MWLYSRIIHALVAVQGNTIFHALIWWQQQGIATWTSKARYLASLVLTSSCSHGLPVLCLSAIQESGQHTMAQSTLPIQVTGGTSVVPGRGRDTRWLWIRFPVGRGVEEQPHFLLTPSSTNVANAVDWVIIHALAVGKLARCDHVFSLISCIIIIYNLMLSLLFASLLYYVCNY